jgi:hypothetical protein
LRYLTCLSSTDSGSIPAALRSAMALGAENDSLASHRRLSCQSQACHPAVAPDGLGGHLSKIAFELAWSGVAEIALPAQKCDH